MRSSDPNHEINFRGAPYELVPEYFVNSLLVLMTTSRPMQESMCVCAISSESRCSHNIKFEVDEDSDQIKFWTSTYIVLSIPYKFGGFLSVNTTINVVKAAIL